MLSTQSDHLETTHRHVLVTAGPTREPIDDVRYLSNRSSGTMGTALASEAARRGMPTTLLLGPVSASMDDLQGPCLDLQRFETTAELQSLLETQFPHCTMLIMAAAVADFIPRRRGAGKLSRRDGPLQLELDPAPDLLARCAQLRTTGQHCIGFALEEAGGLIEAARAKLRRKGVDAIVANPLETMESATVSAHVCFPRGDDVAAPPSLAKQAFAVWLWDLLEDRFLL